MVGNSRQADGEFVQRAEQSLPRLKQTTCHNLMTLARHLPLLEQHQPDSRQAGGWMDDRQQSGLLTVESISRRWL